MCCEVRSTAATKGPIMVERSGRSDGVRAAAFLFALSLAACAGCRGGALDEARAEQARNLRDKTAAEDDLRRERATAAESHIEQGRQIAEWTDRLRLAEEQSRTLHRTPRYQFDLAVAAEDRAMATNSDDEDRAAIEAFRAVTNGSPGSSLASIAAERARDLEHRITERASAERGARATIAHLVAVCRRESASVAVEEAGEAHFNLFNDVDMNAVTRGEQRAEAHRRAMTAAQERARALLATVRDSDGSLREQISGCDADRE